jgi:sugar lactone lactonase YvrE
VFGGMAYLECPRWHDGRIWVSDFYTHRVLAAVPGNEPETVVEVAGQPAGLGWLANGDLLVNSMKDRLVLRFDGAGTSVYADLSTVSASHLNEMVIDSADRVYVGNLGSDFFGGDQVTTGSLFRIDPDGSVTEVADEILLPNGMVITPDDTLIVSETFGGRLLAYDVTTEGALENRRDWAVLAHGARPGASLEQTLSQLTVIPDGMTADADGAVWLADAMGHRAVRILNGSIVEEISTADSGLLIVACGLGGEDGRTLFLCANPALAEESASLAAMGGRVLATRVDSPHAGRP